jgi:hypothetical protein
VAWDSICADDAGDLCPLCGGGAGGCIESDGCCAANSQIGCADTGCEALVCMFDPYCCIVAWDTICGSEASQVCSVCPGGMNCCKPHGGLGCSDPECEATVCAVDPFCCNVAWDSICAEEAFDLCFCTLP